MAEPRISVDRAAIDEATKWFSLLRSGEATPEDRRAFEEWRGADARHAAAYDGAVAIWNEIGDLEDLRKLASDPNFGRPSSSLHGRFAGLFGRLFPPRPVGYAALALAALMTAAILFLQPAWLLPGVYATRTAETSRITLADGSVVDLAPESKMRVAYSAGKRRVFLKRGEAFFNVRKGDARAFVVASGDAVVRVTGTKFNIHNGPAGVTVSVAEGIVEVRRKGEPGKEARESAERRLSAGEQVAVPRHEMALASVAETPPSTVGIWRSGRLNYNGAPLREVIADANRYSRVPIVVADKKLLNLTLVAAFRTDQIDAMIDGLPEILPLEIDRSRRDRIVLRARVEYSS
ncbi:MAG TPA: FecR domain-containing protein [Parvularculaceae bacterium]|nr:FecR domain-containing protein [Parvularculaceae bacterium]